MTKHKIWKEWKYEPSVFDECWQLEFSIFYSNIILKDGKWHTDKSVGGGLPVGNLVFKGKESAMIAVQKMVIKEYKKIKKVMEDKL